MSEGAPQKKEEAPIILPEVESHPRQKAKEALANLIARLEKEMGQQAGVKKSQEKKLGHAELKRLKKEAAGLGETYELEIEQTEKARAFNKWTEALKKYRALEEKLDLSMPKNATETDYRARFAELRKAMEEARERYDLEVEKTEKALAHSKWAEAEKKYREMEEFMDLLSSEKNKKAKEENPEPKPEPPAPHPENETQSPEPAPESKPESVAPHPEGGTNPPEPIPEPKPEPPTERLQKVAIVDAEAQVDLLARMRGNEQLNQKLNHESWLKRKWAHIWEEGYRQQLIGEEKKKILGQANLPGFIRRTLFGAKSFEATGEKNLFVGTGAEGQNREELGALAARFAKDLHQESEGEVKKQLEDPEFSKKINDLIYEFATSNLPEAQFMKQKESLVSDISAKYPDAFAQGGLTADNILEAAREFQKIYTHSNALARTDVNLSIDVGKAKGALKTKTNINFVDKVVGSVQKYTGLSPEAAGFAASIGSYFIRKPLYWLGGAAGAGGLIGMMRRNVEQKNDLAMHRVERAMGAGEPGAGGSRREAAEQFVYEMRPASEIITEIQDLRQIFEKSPSKQAADALTASLADAEARHSLSELRKGDLVSFSGETSLERGRLQFVRALSEAKISLKSKGFEGDVEKTELYKNALETLSGEMDKVDRSEKMHRWSENTKAAAVGAVGGLLVGGLVQEGLALLGDHVQMLSWLRPSGRLTSGEALYHAVKGDLPVAPTGAGLYQFNGLPSSSGVIKIDGTTELIPDRTTGLMDLVDKTNPFHILAKMNIDTAGHVTPVPGSYDPALVTFGETKVGGGIQTLQEWIKSMHGKFGSNVAEDSWHTKGFLDNDTPLKPEFNELKLLMSYDENGDLKIDASKLKEYAQDALGAQTGGSKHGAHVLDVAKEFAKGTVKIGLAPDGSHQTSVLELKYDPSTHAFVAPHGAHIQDFFEPDAKGRPVLKGDGLLGIVHELGVQKDGSKNVEWVNAIRGNGHPVLTGEQGHVVTEINRNTEQSWWGPWVWNFRRKPLETVDTYGGIMDAEGKPFEHNPQDFEAVPTPEEEGEKIKGRIIKKKTVDTRGQKIKSDAKDWEKEYPEKFPIQSEQEMADFLVSQGRFIMPREDYRQFMMLDTKQRKEFIVNRIRGDREELRIGNDRRLPQKEVGKLIDLVLAQVAATFDSLSKEHSQLPSKERIHVVGILEFQAQLRRANAAQLGVCFDSSGEIFVNFDILVNAALSSGGGSDEVIAELKRTIAHEVTHGAAANNYWMFESDQGETATIIRRGGLRFVRTETVQGDNPSQNPSILIIERGRALNEAITEELAQKVTRSIYTSEGGHEVPRTEEAYSMERDVLKKLERKFGILFEDFARAAINRKSLRPLAEKLDGKPSKAGGEEAASKIDAKMARPQFTPLLLSVMDYEFNQKQFGYDVTKRLIDGRKGIVISKQMKKIFASNLLDRNGAIKQSLVETYGLIDEEEAMKTRVAA